MLGFVIFLLFAIPLICILIDRFLRYDGSSAKALFDDWRAAKREYQKDSAKWGR
ncbi:hypothetical protein [Mesorhizobium sp. M8A.F.Ca.ET.021.01.1.1]|uniref:hypothetical protein n=1 Tax=Mesorhizobium sp. M8A.F.Ca.ET.021.01.1.1 TaxID=2496757 RepID=UPI00167AC654|nr:hypothetical protein [Mesorhizobium sp. M8A.F.Ca.ET.021.01.1.1]